LPGRAVEKDVATHRMSEAPGNGESEASTSLAALHALKALEDALLIGRINTRPLRSEEHTSELQSRENLVCRLLLEKKKK